MYGCATMEADDDYTWIRRRQCINRFVQIAQWVGHPSADSKISRQQLRRRLRWWSKDDSSVYTCKWSREKKDHIEKCTFFFCWSSPLISPLHIFIIRCLYSTPLATRHSTPLSISRLSSPMQHWKSFKGKAIKKDASVKSCVQSFSFYKLQQLEVRLPSPELCVSNGSSIWKRNTHRSPEYPAQTINNKIWTERKKDQ